MKRHLVSFLIIGITAAALICCMGMGRFAKERNERTEKLSAQMTGIEQLSVDTSYGDIKIKGADTNDCNVSAKISVESPSPGEAKSLAEQIKITLVKEANTIFVRAQKPTVPKNASIGISYTITVPKKIALECKCSYGNIRLADIIGDITANTNYGDIIVETVSGKLQLNTSYGKVDCKQIISPDFSANSNFGDIFARFSTNCPPDLKAKIATSYGDIDADIALNFAGDVFIDTGFGKIKTDLAIVVKGERNKSHLAGTIGRGGKGLLELKTSFGSVKIE